MAEFDLLFNIFLVGDPNTGKSSILQKFAENSFNESYFSSIGVDIKYKDIKIEDSTIKLKIMDTSVQESFKMFLSSILLSYRKSPNAMIVVFDKNCKETYDHLEFLVEKFNINDLSHTLIVLVGTKCDLEPKVSFDEVQEEALRCQVVYMEVSAKTGEQIDNLFEIVARMLYDMYKSN